MSRQTKTNQSFMHPYPPAMRTAEYICEEIKKNVKSLAAKELISLISKYKMTPLGRALVMSSPLADTTFRTLEVEGRIRAYSKWASLVAGGKIWDHKDYIRVNIQEGQIWACDSTTRLKFMYDIWSNIHYGFVGKFVGFTEWELVNGAGAAQVWDNTLKPLWDNMKSKSARELAKSVLETSPRELAKSVREGATKYVANRFVDIGDADILGGFDDAEDTQAIKVGFSLFNKFGKTTFALTPQNIINEIQSFYYKGKPMHVGKCEYHR